jgi:hypothetical protein
MAKSMGITEGELDDDFDAEEDDDDFNANTPQSDLPSNAFGSKSFSRSGSASAPYLPAGAVPTVNGKLSQHAKEFWFPESRECKCCKGFKHGCDCCNNNGFHACQEEGCCEEGHKGKKASAATSADQGISVSIPNKQSPRHNSAGGAGIPSPNAYCRFELTPQGCRFGSACRFRHMSGSLDRTNSLESPKHGDPRAFCPYFMKGNCDFGDKCRFAHI